MEEKSNNIRQMVHSVFRIIGVGCEENFKIVGALVVGSKSYVLF